MPKFKYTARDLEGKSLSGVIEAKDGAELRRILRMNNVYLTGFKARGATDSGSGARQPGFLDPNPSLEDLVITMRQLGVTVRAGLPLVQALDLVGSQTNKLKLQSAFREMEQEVTEGKSLSESMKKYPKLFGPLAIALIEAGEVAGTLDQTLELLAHQLERENDTKRKVSAALIYPKLVVAACFGTIALMLVLVVPTFAGVYKGFHTKLPAQTLLLISISNFVVTWWWLIVGSMVGGYFAYRAYKRTAPGKKVIDTISLKIPIVGPVLRKLVIARSLITLAGALKGGVPVLKSIEISAKTADSYPITSALRTASRNIEDGSTLSRELTSSGQFPLMVTRMIAAGESTGEIDAMLSEINRFYEQDVDFAVNKLTRMLEPLMTVFVGAIVLLVLVALYMPIFQLSQTILGAEKGHH